MRFVLFNVTGFYLSLRVWEKNLVDRTFGPGHSSNRRTRRDFCADCFFLSEFLSYSISVYYVVWLAYCEDWRVWRKLKAIYLIIFIFFFGASCRDFVFLFEFFVENSNYVVLERYCEFYLVWRVAHSGYLV